MPETVVPTHGGDANRNDNTYIDNSKTYHQVVRDNSVGVEFAGNYPGVTRPATEAQVNAWRILLRVSQTRYGIPLDHVYAHNWSGMRRVSNSLRHPAKKRRIGRGSSHRGCCGALPAAMQR